MKTIELQLQTNEAIVLNDPIYLELDDNIEFVVINPSGKLYFSINDESVEMKGNVFRMAYDAFREIEKLSIIEKTEDSLYPKYYPVTLKLHDVTVLGRTVDEKYPEVVQMLNEEIKMLKKAVIELYDLHNEKEKEGVIE